MTEQLNMRKTVELTGEFATAFNQRIDVIMASKLVLEESYEVMEALFEHQATPDTTNTLAENFIKEIADLIYVIAGLKWHYNQMDRDLTNREKLTMAYVLTVSDQVSEIVETYVSSALEMDMDDYSDLIWEAVARVHASNMSKLGADGKPLFREDGKILKGPNYQPPFLEDLAKEFNTLANTSIFADNAA